MRNLLRLGTFCLTLVIYTDTSAYCIQGNSACPQTGVGWPAASATFYSNGFQGSNATFNSAFAEAINRWNGLSNFKYSSVAATSDPCVDDNTDFSIRSWEFNNTYCGTSFGGSTLAVAITYADSFTPTVNNIIDADIIFNSNFSWSVYSGPSTNPIDFRRVAVHESGHALGLDHELSSAAIMAPVIGSIVSPQADDIAGLQALYGRIASSPSTGSRSDIPPILLLLLLD